jgi:hypothetical protein
MTIPPQITITEDGEAMGTLHQFATHLNRSRAFVLRCVHGRARDAIILHAGEGLDRLLILDAEGYQALHRCTALPRAA